MNIKKIFGFPEEFSSFWLAKIENALEEGLVSLATLSELDIGRTTFTVFPETTKIHFICEDEKKEKGWFYTISAKKEINFFEYMVGYAGSVKLTFLDEEKLPENVIEILREQAGTKALPDWSWRELSGHIDWRKE